jgi:Mg-chelatase subunit ChlD
MKKSCIFFLLFFTVTFGFSQGFITNSSFSTESKKVIHRPAGKKMKGFPAGWNVLAEDLKVDYFNSVNSTFHGFPLLKPKESGGRMGFPLYQKENKMAGLQTKLTQPLKEGKRYEVSMVISQCDYSNYAVNKIPFVLSKDAISLEDIKQREDVIVNVVTLDNYITYPQQWIKVRAVFTANGGEEYFTLMSIRERFGNAKETRSFDGCKDSRDLDKYFDDVAYYFIDAIELVEVGADYKGVCYNSLQKENARDQQLIEKVEALKSKKIIHPTSPTSFSKMKSYTHHIVLFDISGSMTASISNSKAAFEKIYANVKDSDIVSAMVFTSFSKVLFTRAHKAEELRKRVNELAASGGTILETGLMLVNNNIVADENTIIYLITDVGKNQISDKLVQYVSIKLNKTRQLGYYYEYSYANNYTNKPFYNASSIYESSNVFRVHNMSRKDAKNFEKQMNTENYLVNNINKCRFNEVPVAKEVDEVAQTFRTRNYVFLVDASSSMRLDRKMENLKVSMVKFTRDLSHSDVSSLITYNSVPKLMVDRISNYKIDSLNSVLKKINPNGGTAAEAAIKYTYDYYGGSNNSHQNVTILMFTDGVFKVTSSIASIIEKNRNIHFKVFQFGTEKNEQLQQLESQKLIEYKIVSNDTEIIDELLSKTKEEYQETDTPYSKARFFKKVTRFL